MSLEERVWKALNEVIDPEFGLSVVELGFIYEVKVENEGNVHIKMTLTNPYCPFHRMFVNRVEEAVRNLGVKNVDVELVFDPPWTPERISPEGRKKLGLL